MFNASVKKQIALLAILSGTLFLFASVQSARSDDATAPTSQPVNLALNKPASASTTESDEHAAAKANDGDENTRWCADNDSVPQWWQVDLQTKRL